MQKENALDQILSKNKIQLKFRLIVKKISVEAIQQSIMEELLKHPILTLTLPANFDPQLWYLLTREPASVYQAQMRAITELLDRHLPQLTTPYYRFIQNQLTINLWHKNEPQLRIVIEPYLFGQHPQPQIKPLRLKSTPYHHSSQTEPSAVRKYFAENVGSPRFASQIEMEPINNHKLFMETFKACQGKKYVAYNYQKHMKHSKQKVKYNQFIRNNHHRNKSSPVTKSNSLQRFQEWEVKKGKKTSLVNFRKILEDISLNNEKGLQKMLKKQGTQKLVLINHQRKPINYYLSQAHLKQRG